MVENRLGKHALSTGHEVGGQMHVDSRHVGRALTDRRDNRDESPPAFPPASDARLVEWLYHVR